jgi:hypothetical protein
MHQHHIMLTFLVNHDHRKAKHVHPAAAAATTTDDNRQVQ